MDIIVRVRHAKGFSRLTVNTKETVRILKEKIAQLVSSAVNDFGIFFDQSLAIKDQLMSPDSTLLGLIPKFKNGVEIFLKQKPQMSNPSGSQPVPHTVPPQTQSLLSQNCNHSVTQRCINCITPSAPVDANKSKEKDEPYVNKCTHPEGGSCLNCIEKNKKGDKDEKTEKKECKKQQKYLCYLLLFWKNKINLVFANYFSEQKWLCQHGPTGKCSHCLDNDYISNIKHVSFTHFIDEKKLKCKGVHPPSAKCFNCTPPSEQRMMVDTECKNHEPWPKAMCNKCLPPNVIINRQPYRHVDFAQFMNVKDVSSFVQSWTQSSHAEQKMGFLYGYYAEDPNYKGGVRAIIEAIYEPPQVGDISGFNLLQDPYETQVNIIAESLSLEKIGWVFTTINHDTFLSSHEIRMAAKFQEEHRVLHESGYPFSTFITVVLRTGKENASEIKPEVYMVSDLAQVMEKNNIFGDSDRRKFMKVRDSKDERDVLPSIIVSGKTVTEFEPDFFIVNVAHGHSAHNKFSIIKHADFPVENRQDQNPNEVKKYLQKFKSQKSWEKFSDFHLLIYLSKLIDVETTMVIAQAVAEEKDVPNACEDLVKGIVGF